MKGLPALYKVLLLGVASLGILVYSAHAQDQTVTGEVTDASSGEALPGVNIVVKGTTIGTATDSDGAYRLSVPSLSDTLVFSFVGYQPREIPIDGRTVVDAALQVEAVIGDEVLVIGYGTQREENVTGAVTPIDGAELAEQSSVQTSAALMGRAPGVTVTQNSGQPGENQGTIRIRGIGTLGGNAKNNPLVLIDGVPGDIDNVPASDIENISVLKDAASAAIYGSRAANGVILVTTKRGQRGGGFQVSYNSRAGIQTATGQPEYVEGGEFMRLENLGATNLGKEPVWSEEYIEEWEANHETNPDQYPNTDWVETVFSETATQMQHALSISGGTGSVLYRGSLQYDSETAEIVNFENQRYSARLNTDVDVADDFSFNFDFNAVREDQQEPAQGINLVTRQAYRVPPVYAARYSNGLYGPGFSPRNPLAAAESGGLNSIEHYTIRGRLRASYEPVSGLQFNVQYAPEYDNLFVKDMTKQWTAHDPEGNELFNFPSTASLNRNYSRSFTQNLNITGSYQHAIESHNFEVLGGYELVDFRTDFFDAFRDDFTLQDFEQLNAGSQANQQNSGSAAENSLMSVFGRLSYDYDAKYLLEANLRYDGSSRFLEDNRWGLFPSVSAGWRISEESFMQPVEAIDELKVRGSWGQLGNQKIGNYPFAALVNLGQNFIFGGSVVSGAAQLDLANADISWESTTTSNVGVDATLLRNRVDLSFDWFTRTTNDILLQLPIPRIIGLDAPFQNAGEVNNSGWELSVGYNDAIGRDFTYDVSFNISDIENEVIDLRGAGPFISGTSIIREGDPINSIYGFEADGLFQSQEEIDSHAEQSGQIAPGDIKYVDQNGDGTINADDRVIIGNPFPNYNYGFDVSAGYRGFDVSAFFQGVGSQDVLLQGDATWALSNAGKVTTWQAEQYWRPEKPDNDYPRLTQTTSQNNFQTSSFWVYDASYLRLRSLQVGYTIPDTWAEAISAREFRVYVVGQNLFTVLDNMPPGIDPNVPNATPGAFFPIQKVYSVGVNLSF